MPLHHICVSLYSYHVLLQAYKLKSITTSCVWGRFLSLSTASQWTCSETVHLCWKEELPIQHCLFGSLFPVVLWPRWELLCWGSIPRHLTLSLCWHNGSFVPIYTASVGPSFVFSAIICSPTPARSLVAASSERNVIKSRVNAVKWGCGKWLSGIRLWCW